MTIDPMTGWPVPFHKDNAAQEYLCVQVRHYLGQTDMPLWVLKDRIFFRDDLPESLRVPSIDLQFALTERAARECGGSAVWTLEPRHRMW